MGLAGAAELAVVEVRREKACRVWFASEFFNHEGHEEHEGSEQKALITLRLNRLC